MNLEDAGKIFVQLNNKELISRYKFSSENELEVDPVFDQFFNSPGLEEDLFVKTVETPLKELGYSLKKVIREGKVESVQMQYDENPSIFNNFKTDVDTGLNLINFFTQNKEGLLRGESFPLNSFKGYKKLSKILVLSDVFVYVPGVITEWCEMKVQEIEDFDDE